MKKAIAVFATSLVMAAMTALPIAGQAEQPRIYIESAATVDASNSKDKAKQVDFGTALSAALIKKEVPVIVVTDKSKSKWTIQSESSQKEDSTGTKVAKLLLGGGGNFTQFQGTIRVIDNETSAILYAYNVKKDNFQSAAEAFAKHFKNDYLRNR
jgi:hypothetical protein